MPQTGQPPFLGSSKSDLVGAIVRCDFFLSTKLSAEAEDFLYRAMRKDYM